MQDEYFMRLALQLAQLGKYQTTPNPMVGAVLVKENEIVGQGAHLKAGEPHAEVHALRMAGDKAKGATLYVTLEPCSHYGRTPPCADAVVHAGVRRVVIAMEDSNPVVQGKGIERLRRAGVEVVTGVLAQDAYRLNEMFFTWAKFGRPFIVWKCAATLDGYIAAHSGDSRYVTGDESRLAVQQLRKELPAIAVGIGTVLADDPRLTVHDETVKQPLRVIFDSRLRSPFGARMLQEPGGTLIYTLCNSDEINQSDLGRFRGNLEIVTVPANSRGRICLSTALRDLANRDVTGVLVEGGSALASEFLKERLVDKVIYYVAPKLLGGGISAVKGLEPERMADAIELRDVSWTMSGRDARVEGYPVWG